VVISHASFTLEFFLLSSLLWCPLFVLFLSVILSRGIWLSVMLFSLYCVGIIHSPTF
jgi:hypothetical protein